MARKPGQKQKENPVECTGEVEDEEKGQEKVRQEPSWSRGDPCEVSSQKDQRTPLIGLFSGVGARRSIVEASSIDLNCQGFLMAKA